MINHTPWNRTFLCAAAAATLVASSGWVYAYRAQAAPQRYLQSIERAASRVLHFGDRTIAGEYHIEIGSAAWKAEYAAHVANKEQIADGTRMRMGANFWSTLESTIDLRIGGAEVPAGYYYLSFEKAGDHVNLVAFDAAELRQAKVGSHEPPQQGGIVIPMTLSDGHDLEDRLAADFVVENSSSNVTLEVAWGPFRLTAAVEGTPQG